MDKYIPKNLDDCFVQLKKILNSKQIDEIKNKEEDTISIFHHGLGRSLRNSWGLWSSSRLSEWFNSKGIFHPDDMSTIILKSFWRHLNFKTIELNKQIKFYKNYWDQKKKKGARK